MNMSWWCLLFFLLFLFQTGCFSSPSPQLCHRDERSALLQLKQKHYYVSPPYYNDHVPLNSWNPNTDCCFWEGVTCDGTSSHIVGLDLFDSSLFGSIDSNSTLFHLHHLQLLNLSWNRFDYFDPSGFDMLSRLMHLNFSYNYFAGPIPSQLSQLTDLVSLDISSNQFGGQMPSQISKLTKLVSLDLSSNYGVPQLEIPNLGVFVQNLSNLRELHLDYVKLSAPNNRDWCRHLSSALPNLQVLSMRACSLIGLLDASISSLRFLSELYLDSNSNLYSTVPTSLMNLTSLTVLSLNDCRFHGDFPINVFLQPNLRYINLGLNPLLSGYLPEFHQVNNSALQFLDIGGTKFQGKLPSSIANLKFLKVLSIGDLNMSGPIPPFLANLTHLTKLDLSINNNFIGQIPSFFRGSFPDLEMLLLGDNLLQGPIHSYLFFLPSLTDLDLSYNQFSGVINEPIHNISSSSSIRHAFNLEGNNLKGLDLMKSISKIKGTFELLELSFNDFSYIVEDENLSYAGLSSNDSDDDNFVNAQIQALLMTSCNISKFPDFLRNQKELSHLKLSDNRISKFPDFIRDLLALDILDLSNNQLSGTIPTCLGSSNLGVLDLESNKLQGPIPPTFKIGCKLHTLKLSKNMLQGKVPRSLGNCKELTVLDIAYNQLNDTFPFWLENLSKLQVLVMRSNRFGGPIAQHSRAVSPFQSLHVIDISFNNFSGNLPLQYIYQWKAMMFDGEASELRYQSNFAYYQDILLITEKSLQLKMQNFTTCATVDLSNNNFKGKIPDALGILKALKVLNLSGNSLTGQIPFSLGNLSELESLDLSGNKLSGEIPRQLTSLTFLEVLNLAYNNFTGSIPRGNRFDMFSNTSYEENAGLCGLPLSRKCGTNRDGALHLTSASQQEDDSTCLLDWKFALAGYCSGVIIGLVIGQQLFWRKK